MKIIFALILISLLATTLKAQDLQAEINQTTFDKIISSAKIPMTLFEYKDPFEKMLPGVEKNLIPNDDLITKSFTPDESKNFFKWAVEDKAKFSDEESIFKNALQLEWDNVHEQIQILIEENDKVASQSIKGVDKGELTYQDYTIDELKKLQNATVEETFKFFNAKEKGAFGLKAHLSYFRLDLNSRPNLKVSSPNFDINNILSLAHNRVLVFRHKL